MYRGRVNEWWKEKYMDVTASKGMNEKVAK
jgi:hypothetical protein